MQRVLAFGPFELDTGDFTLAHGDVRTRLQPKTFDALLYLAENPQRVVTREELLEAVWEGTHVTPNTVDQVISKIRRAMGKRRKILRTVPRRGFKLMASVSVRAEEAPPISVLPELFGRDDEKEVVGELLGPHALVTLLGPGGVGKTTLARATLDGWSQPGRFVDLAPCRSKVDVVSAMANVLGVPAQAGRGELGESLGRAIASSGVTLFVLDNLEQVSDEAAPLVASWSAVAPEVRFLATSRHRLGLRGERVVEVGPLAIEHAADLLRARVEELDVAVGQDLTDEHARAIAEAVEGLPLAIELAANQLLAVDAAELAATLRTTLRGPDRHTGHPPRQRSMRATLLWSWGLLPAWARDAAEQLSVFRAPFPPDLAEATLDLSRHADAPDPLRVLGALRSRSLLTREPGKNGRARMRMFEAVRTFGSEALWSRGGQEAAHLAHEKAVLGLVADDVEYRGKTFPYATRQRLEPLVPELQAVWERACARGDWHPAAAAALVISKQLYALGLHAAARDTVAVVAESGPRDDPLVQRVALAHARLLANTDSADSALERLAELENHVHPSLEYELRLRVVSIRRDRGEPVDDVLIALSRDEDAGKWVRAQAQIARVCAAVRADDPGDLVADVEQAVRMAEALGDEWLILAALNALFETRKRMDDPRRGAATLERAITRAEEFHLPLQVAGLNVNLAHMHALMHQREQAKVCLHRAQLLSERLGDLNLRSFVELLIASDLVEFDLDLDAARPHFERARAGFAQIARHAFEAGALTSRGFCALAVGADDEAMWCAEQALEILGDDATVRWRANLIRARVALVAGDLEEVDRRVAEGLEALGEGWGYVHSEFLAVCAVARALSGDLDEARRLRAEAFEALGDHQGMTTDWVVPLLTLVDATAGDPAPAREAVQRSKAAPSFTAHTRWAVRLLERHLAG